MGLVGDKGELMCVYFLRLFYEFLSGGAGCSHVVGVYFECERASRAKFASACGASERLSVDDRRGPAHASD